MIVNVPAASIVLTVPPQVGLGKPRAAGTAPRVGMEACRRRGRYESAVSRFSKEITP
jgi:hypothetical protein